MTEEELSFKEYEGEYVTVLMPGEDPIRGKLIKVGEDLIKLKGKAILKKGKIKGLLKGKEEIGIYDVSSVEVEGKEKVSKKEKVKMIIKDLEKEEDKDVAFKDDIIDRAMKYMERESAEEILRKLKEEAFCYEPKPDMIKSLK